MFLTTLHLSADGGPLLIQVYYYGEGAYVQRGTPELWVKDLKLACKADRLSDHRFWANQFRLALASGHLGQALWSLLAALPSGRVHNSG